MKPTQTPVKLTAKQRKTLCRTSAQQIPSKYWNHHISQCFKPYKSSGQNNRFLENQTFKEFIEMDLTRPNQEGTGRFPFDKIQCIKFSFIQKKPVCIHNSASNISLNSQSKKSKINAKKAAKAQNDKFKTNNQSIEEEQTKMKKKIKNLAEQSEFKFAIKAIAQILTAFFKIPASYEPSINISIDPQTNNLVDEKQMIEFQMQQNCKKNPKKSKKLSRPTYDVWKLIDIGIQYKNKKTSLKKPKSKQSIHLFLIDADLLEDDNQIDGRATGDGVAFISFRPQDFSTLQLEKDFLAQKFSCYTIPILIHECLHTLGFDHCSGWQCLMNSVTNEEVLLCPGCARKMDSEIGEKASVKEWYVGMTRALQELKVGMKEIYGAQRSIKMFANILYSKAEVLKIQEEVNGNKKIKDIKLIEAKQGMGISNLADSSFILNQPSSMLEKCLFIVKAL